MRLYIEQRKAAETVSVSDVVSAAVATLVFDNDKILLGRRFTDNQFMGWQCPGGYLHQEEGIEQAARRHCLQKAGIEISDLYPGPYSNNIFSDHSHTVTLYTIAEAHRIQNQKLYESEQAQWDWFGYNELPEKLFLPLYNVLNQHKISDIRKK